MKKEILSIENESDWFSLEEKYKKGETSGVFAMYREDQNTKQPIMFWVIDLSLYCSKSGGIQRYFKLIDSFGVESVVMGNLPIKNYYVTDKTIAKMLLVKPELNSAIMKLPRKEG